MRCLKALQDCNSGYKIGDKAKLIINKGNGLLLVLASKIQKYIVSYLRNIHPNFMIFRPKWN